MGRLLPADQKGVEIPSDAASGIFDAILAATQQATAELEGLARKSVPGDRIFEEVKKVTESHVRAVAKLGERFSALPVETRLAFTQSAAAGIYEKRVNDALNSMKALVFGLTKDVPTARLYFSSREPQQFAELLKGHAAWPSEPDHVVTSKYEFIRAFLLGVTNFTDVQRSQMLVRIEMRRREALKGDGVATAQLNAILKEIIEVYPKERAEGRYNLGLLYTDIGDEAEAEKWLSKAAAQGFQQAAIKLEQLRSSKQVLDHSPDADVAEWREFTRRLPQGSSEAAKAIDDAYSASGIPLRYWVAGGRRASAADLADLHLADHPCGRTAGLQSPTIPPQDKRVSAEPVFEIDSSGRELRRWQVPVDHPPIGVVGDELIVHLETGERRDLVLAVNSKGHYRVVLQADVTSRLDAVACPKHNLFNGSAYSQCARARDSAAPERLRYLVYERPCS